MYSKGSIGCNSIRKEINESINRKSIEKIYENQSRFFKKIKLEGKFLAILETKERQHKLLTSEMRKTVQHISWILKS